MGLVTDCIDELIALIDETQEQLNKERKKLVLQKLLNKMKEEESE